MDVEKAIEFILQRRARHEGDIIELRQLHIAAEKRADVMDQRSGLMERRADRMDRRAERYVRLGMKMMNQMREDTDRKVNALTESHLRLEDKFNRWLDSQPKRNGSDRQQ